MRQSKAEVYQHLVWATWQRQPYVTPDIERAVYHCIEHEQLPGHDAFRWQEGYGVFSLGRNQLKHVLAYVQNQKRHHASGKTWPQWEETDEEYIPPDDK